MAIVDIETVTEPRIGIREHWPATHKKLLKPAAPALVVERSDPAPR